MIRDRRSSQRGLYVAVSLVAVLAVAFSARPLEAAPRSDSVPTSAPTAQCFPTRIEGYLKTQNGAHWLVDQTPVRLGPTTKVHEIRGKAQIGAFMRVAGQQYPDRLEADTVEVLRPAGAPAPAYQFTGRLTKKTSTTWTVEEVLIDLLSETKYVGDIRLNGLVRATVRRVDNRLEALEFAAIAPTPSAAPFAIEGVVKQVDAGAWHVDDQVILVPPEQEGEANPGDTVEIEAVRNSAGALVAEDAQVVDPARDAPLSGYVTEVNSPGQDNQTWTMMVLQGTTPERRTIHVAPDTYVDEDRAVIGANVEARVVGVVTDAANVDAALIRLEQPVPATIAGTLTAASPDELWMVDGQRVWFESDQLKSAARSIAELEGGTGISAEKGRPAKLAVRGVRLSNGVVVAQEVMSHQEAVAAGLVTDGAAPTQEPAPMAADEWRGPYGINSPLSSASKPTVLFDAGQSGHAVYESGGKIYYAHQPRGGSWGGPRKIGTGTRPAAAFDSKGQLHVVYTSEFMGKYDILHVRLTPTGWSLPYVVAPTSGNSDDPAIAADASGKIYVAWMDYTSGEWAIQIGTWDGVYWTSAPVPNARGQSPSLTVMPDGMPFLAWQDRVPLGSNVWGKYDIYTSERTKDTWSLAVNVSDNRQFRPNSDALGARVVAAEGHAHIAWINDKTQVRYVFGRGQYWPVPVDVTEQRPLGRGLSMQLAADSSLYIAWDEGTSLRVAASPPRTETWPKATVVATRSANASSSLFDVSLATGGNGVSVAWVQRYVSGTLGVFESRRNMEPVMLKGHIPFIVSP